MHIEVLCTGDELLTGLTGDTNSPYFMSKLFECGESVRLAQTVADVREDIVTALKTVAQRSDAVLVSGGLGPTADDLTAECAATAAGVELVEDVQVLETIKQRFARRGIELTPNNLKQALVPAQSEVVKNPVGTAPMFIQSVGRCTLFYVPGVPSEYRALVDQEVLPRLEKMIGRQPNRVFRAACLLKCVALPESHLDALVAPVAKAHPRVRVGFRTHAPENHLKLLAEGATQSQADRALHAAEQACRQVLGDHIFGSGKEELADCVGMRLEEAGATVGVAESCTGGLVSQLLTSRPGASKYVVGGLVTYHDAMKLKWAHVDSRNLTESGAVSEAVARQMARGIRLESEATYGLSVTGFAGPEGGADQTPVGTVFCALAWAGEDRCERHLFSGDRLRVRQFAAHAALDLLRRHLIHRASGGEG